MEKFFNRTKNLIFTKQSGMFSSAIILAVMIVVSRVFGFLRYRILAGYFMKGELDIFFASFRIPDLVFEILITGALTSSFIPIFIKYQKNKEELEANISSIINLISLILFVCIGIVYLSLEKVMPFITPGFDAKKIQEVIFYSQILLVGQLPFLVMGNFLTGIGQASKTFLITAIAPIVYNLAVIVITLLFAKNLFLLAPIFGTVLGAMLFFIIQVPLLFLLKINYRPIIVVTRGLKEFFHMVVPRVLTVIVTQIDATIDLTLTTLLGTGSYTIFYFAQHLQLLPVSVIGIAFGQASLPYLSEMYQEKKIEELKKVITDSLLNILFFTIPFMCFFVFARTPLVRLFYGGQKFDWDATVLTAITLSYFSLSIPFHSVYYFITRCFYALMDSKTPFYLSLVSVVINTLLSLYFILVLKLPVWSLSISFSTAIIINVILLFFILMKKLNGFYLIYMVKEMTKISVASLVPSVIVYYLIKLLDGLVFDTTRTINVFFLLLTGSVVYILLYVLLSWFLNVKEMSILSRLAIKTKEYKNKIIEMYANYE